VPTNDVRREAAARLREIDEDVWSRFSVEANDIRKAIGLSFFQRDSTVQRLSDLIEPEPERTCRLVTHKHPAGRAFERDLYCSECDTLLWDSCGDPFYSLSVEEQKFCYNCGAKVVKEWHE
jgi:hypothetical protein